ncbi:MAG: hypothetical protein WAV92_08965 [Halopseudomonas yangmingensis]|uniref:Uncharacterized protein n=1 Tax=Halopseudomonas yangmingensis TaxID=1720063 RepID=A0A1I4U273_9GAMM|nr:hypothetical protein [Halopseudomonas yangmingensis]SFM82940.1 hypothetical protein SAMN05216217_11724 [Halopseudomonas yangmingensis]
MDIRRGVRIATLLSVVLLAFFVMGRWMGSYDALKPLDWSQNYADSLWQPLQDQRLQLGDLAPAAGEGRLWLISADDQPLLVSRHHLRSDGQSWRLQAVVGLELAQLDSLVQAQAWQPGMRDLPLDAALGMPLAQQPILRLSMIPEQPVELRYVQGSWGNPDMRLELGEGDQAWVYAKQGLVVAVSGEDAHSMMFGLREEP